MLVGYHRHVGTVKPRFNEPLYNEVLGLMTNIFQPSNSAMYGKEPRYNKPISPVPWHLVKSRFHYTLHHNSMCIILLAFCWQSPVLLVQMKQAQRVEQSDVFGMSYMYFLD